MLILDLKVLFFLNRLCKECNIDPDSRLHLGLMGGDVKDSLSLRPAQKMGNIIYDTAPWGFGTVYTAAEIHVLAPMSIYSILFLKKGRLVTQKFK